ncbi:MAG: HNH endonuclease [Defluviitaleaceae bacterium]|nr:HNH endonuclease [Defluviitaleaceae bacterium]
METVKRIWTREETMLAFELYCTIPSSQVTVNNIHIKTLAKAIGRPANGVKMKLQNFKSLDPSYTADGRAGLSNTSKLDKEICEAYLQNWSALLIETEDIKNHYGLPTVESANGDEIILHIAKDKAVTRKERIGQAFFRKALLATYNNKCCITGISVIQLLRASHIKPWAKSNDINEKANPSNGLLLNALHDAAFDEGYITISSDYKIVVSPQILTSSEENTAFFKQYNKQSIAIPTRFKPKKEFITYHNDVIFQRSSTCSTS